MLSLFCKKNFPEKILKSSFIIFILFMMYHISSAQTVIPLYKEVPNSKPAVNYNEKADTGTDGIIRISKVSVPEITIFQAEKSTGKNAAVIICPGGGYAILAYNLEGTTVAKILNSNIRYRF